MLFSSMTFVFMFLPLVCTAYLLVKKELRNQVLLFASIIFYAWGEPRYLAVMLVTILLNYFGAIWVDRTTRKKTVLTLVILADLSFLVYFKYTDFLIENINLMFHSHISFLRVIMPIGISFYTFQALSYVVDVYRKEVPVQKDIYKLALFITLFPQLVAGPIVKYHDIADQIEDRKETFGDVALGVKRFIVGLAKKMLIANTMGAVADKVFVLQVAEFDTATAWIGALTYSLQIYYDFSGYSDMAIGLCLIFGFKIPENFNYPYISKSITEFWRRWHISLSTWFKQYVYIPLGGNRVSHARTYFNLFVVFLLTGVWHGASWNFVAWGLWNGFFIIFEKATGWNKDKPSAFVRFLQHVYTIFVFIIGWVLFRADTLAYAWQYIRNMFGISADRQLYAGFGYYAGNQEILVFIIGCLLSMPLARGMLSITYPHKVWRTVVNTWLIALFLLSWANIAASTYNPFIYFRF